MNAQSLRTRLIVIILSPLLIVSIISVIWQFQNARERAGDIFDRGLLSAALAISRDVAISGGDALSPATRDLVTDTSGGVLFYHVYAPDGVFVTGYATPPVAPTSDDADGDAEPLYYNAVYQGRSVRVLRFQDVSTIDGLSGIFSTTVWQDIQVRNSFVREVVARSVGVIALLFASVGLIVWFGVGRGLRPLLDLEEAIARRTPSDLEPIRRNVPVETRGIVSTLNSLLERVSRRISSKDEFISNAAHQLRNPIAGVLALAESVENAPTPEAAKSRSAELVVAARNATHLTNQLLSFERAREAEMHNMNEEVNLREVVSGAIERFLDQRHTSSISANLNAEEDNFRVTGDPVMLQEAFLNLLTNAKIHGGGDVSQINVSLARDGELADLRFQDDGIGISPDQRDLVLVRFSQVNSGRGSGLGLPIARRILDNHGGALTIEDSETGALIVVKMPLNKKA